MAKPKSKTLRTTGRTGGTILLSALFFLAVCLSSASTVKGMAVLLLFLTLASVFLFYDSLKAQMRPPLAALALVVLMDGASTLYAVSGKFALYEFLKVLVSFCLALLLLAWTGGNEAEPGRRAAAILSGVSALSGLVSIDLLSTRLISTPVLNLLSAFTPDYQGLSAVEEGVRMTSLFTNPNVFAGCTGLGVLLSLGLAVTAADRREKSVHLVCLYISSLSFLLAFSMGASAMIALAFLTFLALEQPDRRGPLLVVMVETLILTGVSAAVISMTAFSAWDGFEPVPLLCVIAGTAALWTADRFLSRKLSQKLQGRAVLLLTAVILAALTAFCILALQLTGGVTLRAGESLRRAAYPAPGMYGMTFQADGALSVCVESQNQRETMMHTSTVLYDGPLSEAEFLVPEDSLVVYFNFHAEQETVLDSAGYQGQTGSGSLPLEYKLLPGFIANRIQGLFANQNAIQRLVFFSDGMKLFRRSPVFGLGMGAFESGLKSVQSFYYETKYVHNHYIQTLLETGIVGLALFLGLLAVSAAAVWRSRGQGNVPVPALGAALVFMAGHAVTEVTFSSYAYLPMAFGVFALVNQSCASAFPAPEKKAVPVATLLSISALLGVFGVLLGCNLAAQSTASQAKSLTDLTEAIRLDKFEWADYMLSYVNSTAKAEVDEETRQQADAYALRLSRVDSNAIPYYLADYYLCTGRVEQGVQMAEKYVDYVSSDASAWQRAFDLLEQHKTDSEAYRSGMRRMVRKLEAWNAHNMGAIVLEERTLAFLSSFS